MGFNLGSGYEVEGIEILTSSGRKSPVFGNITCKMGYVKDHIIENTRKFATSFADQSDYKPGAP